MYFVLIATPRNLGYIFAHNGLNRDWQRDAIPDILEKTKNISLNLIWSCSIKCFLFYEFYFDNCQTDM